jgi:hypothetical protein
VSAIVTSHFKPICDWPVATDENVCAGGGWYVSISWPHFIVILYGCDITSGSGAIAASTTPPGKRENERRLKVAGEWRGKCSEKIDK